MLPKAIAYKLQEPDETIPEEILDFSKKYNGYKLMDNSKNEIFFLGDAEDYLNINLGNFEFIKNKYNLGDHLNGFGCFDPANHPFLENSCPITGYSRKSDKLNLMPYGTYSFTTFEGFYPGFKPININLDEYVKFDNSEVERLQKTVIDFFRNRCVYEENKSRHNGASLIFGPPGTGKSTAIMNLINSPEFANMYTIFIPKHMSFKYLDDFKDAFSGHNVLIIMEEMTERLGAGTEDILNFLDGYSSWNNCYVIATTNYPEILPPNLVDRPGRFNLLIEVKHPTEDQKVTYFKSKGFSDDEIAQVLPKTKEFSMDYIAQLSLQSKLQKLPLNQCLSALEENKKKVKGAFKGKGSMGL